MPCTYKHNSALEIVEIFLTGQVTIGELQESTSKFIAMEKTQGVHRFLIDTTEMELAEPLSLKDIHDMPARQFLEEGADRLGQVAILPPKSAEARAAVRFYETVCQNRGWLIKIFSERQEASNWLTSGAS